MCGAIRNGGDAEVLRRRWENHVARAEERGTSHCDQSMLGLQRHRCRRATYWSHGCAVYPILHLHYYSD